jgi:hypothetical protein
MVVKGWRIVLLDEKEGQGLAGLVARRARGQTDPLDRRGQSARRHCPQLAQ